MRLTILTENVAGGKYLAEHGLSYLLEIDDEKVLFDTGHTDVFIKNANKMGIDIYNDIEKIVLSHGHWDHGNGLQFLNNKTLITHPNSFIERFRKTDHSPVGLCLTRNEIQKKFNLTETKKPVNITKNLFFLGEIPRTNHFENQSSSFILKNGEDDFILDDSALVAVINNEIVIVTGCSHSGICNICEYAKNVSGISKIKAVIGGFHLTYNKRQIFETIEYFKRNTVEKLFPSHCTGLPALTSFYNEFKVDQIKTGMVFNF